MRHHNERGSSHTPNSMQDMKLKSPNRKVKKCAVEKIRRERINTAMEQLKVLVLSSLQQNVEQYEKMEKADVLEMTVNYLQKVQGVTQRMHNIKTETPDAEYSNRHQYTPHQEMMRKHYEAGYRQSMTEISKQLDISHVSHSCSRRLFNHLNTAVPSSYTPQNYHTAPANTSLHNNQGLSKNSQYLTKKEDLINRHNSKCDWSLNTPQDLTNSLKRPVKIITHDNGQKTQGNSSISQTKLSKDLEQKSCSLRLESHIVPPQDNDMWRPW